MKTEDEEQRRRELDLPCYCLEIVLRGSGQQIRIWGMRNDLHKPFERFMKKEFAPGEHLQVNGYMNTADRASMSVVLDQEEVAVMVLYLEN